jgi:hypothetical protein
MAASYESSIDVHDVDAEVRDHALGHHRADALDQARSPATAR